MNNKKENIIKSISHNSKIIKIINENIKLLEREKEINNIFNELLEILDDSKKNKKNILKKIEKIVNNYILIYKN